MHLFLNENPTDPKNKRGEEHLNDYLSTSHISHERHDDRGRNRGLNIPGISLRFFKLQTGAVV